MNACYRSGHKSREEHKRNHFTNNNPPACRKVFTLKQRTRAAPYWPVIMTHVLTPETVLYNFTQQTSRVNTTTIRWTCAHLWVRATLRKINTVKTHLNQWTGTVEEKSDSNNVMVKSFRTWTVEVNSGISVIFDRFVSCSRLKWKKDYLSFCLVGIFRKCINHLNQCLFVRQWNCDDDLDFPPGITALIVWELHILYTWNQDFFVTFSITWFY